MQFENINRLLNFTSSIKSALKQQHITAPDGSEIDHIELFGKPINEQAQVRILSYVQAGIMIGHLVELDVQQNLPV